MVSLLATKHVSLDPPMQRAISYKSTSFRWTVLVPPHSAGMMSWWNVCPTQSLSFAQPSIPDARSAWIAVSRDAFGISKSRYSQVLPSLVGAHVEIEPVGRVWIGQVMVVRCSLTASNEVIHQQPRNLQAALKRSARSSSSALFQRARQLPM